MNPEISLVITTISPPNEVLITYATECRARNISFIVVGDQKSPADFSLDGCSFMNVEEQAQSGFGLAPLLPLNHYSRKNLGYLHAMRLGSTVIMETDDDNAPKPGFFDLKPVKRIVNMFSGEGWMNVYRYFSDGFLWPRGYPLQLIREPAPPNAGFSESMVSCPIQQGMADGAPDVDAIFRLTRPEPAVFLSRPDLALGEHVWCPFNSQNTVWAEPAFMLLYLPSTCSFRMTDIWRSFIAQRIAWSCGWNILFRESTVVQKRNPHSLMHDFEDEIPGYLNNFSIAAALSALPLSPGEENISANLVKCYEVFIAMGLMDPSELKMVLAWIADVNNRAWQDR
ncbi:MAG: STELLO glycosyltransferase family protein [Bacteroidetes bacterium]|nr:STELLO glycosyltransferase family protein [Bacteroidota bacterium]